MLATGFSGGADAPVAASADDPYSDPVLHPADYESLAGFRSHVRRFFAFSEAATRNAGIPNRHYQAMLAIKVDSKAGTPTMTGLARHLRIELNSAVELVGRMAAAGLVHRTRAPADARRIELTLTPCGAAKLEELGRLHLAHHRAHNAELIRHMASISWGKDAG